MPPPAAASPVLRLFLDPQQTQVDTSFLKTEIPWVDWVRDASDAQVDLIVTTKPSGGGGTTYFFRFIGQKEFNGVDDDLTYTATSVATPDDVRHGLANKIELGLARYVARGEGSDRMSLKFDGPASQTGNTDAQHDPWNSWVYRVGVNGNYNGEAQASSSFTSANMSASRITEDHLFRFNTRGAWIKDRYEIGPGNTLYATTSSFRSSVVEAVGINQHWTWGVLGEFHRSTRQNLESSYFVAPALEYSFWKYSDSTRRELTFLYQIGAGRNRYFEETILRKTAEPVYRNSLAATLTLNQPWGSMSASLNGSAHLNNWSAYSVGVNTSVMLHLGRGFSLNFFGDYTKQQDQISLPLTAATPDQILLHLTQLPSSYSYFGSIGLSYTFGSIFNNAVNTRFQSAAGGGSSVIILSQ